MKRVYSVYTHYLSILLYTIMQLSELFSGIQLYKIYKKITSDGLSENQFKAPPPSQSQGQPFTETDFFTLRNRRKTPKLEL